MTTAPPCPSVAPQHEIRVPIAPDTAQILDALAAVWNCSYRDVLARCVVQAARNQAPHTRLLRVILLQQSAAAAQYATFGSCDTPSLENTL